MLCPGGREWPCPVTSATSLQVRGRGGHTVVRAIAGHETQRPVKFTQQPLVKFTQRLVKFRSVQPLGQPHWALPGWREAPGRLWNVTCGDCLSFSGTL